MGDILSVPSCKCCPQGIHGEQPKLKVYLDYMFLAEHFVLLEKSIAHIAGIGIASRLECDNWFDHLKLFLIFDVLIFGFRMNPSLYMSACCHIMWSCDFGCFSQTCKPMWCGGALNGDIWVTITLNNSRLWRDRWPCLFVHLKYLYHIHFESRTAATGTISFKYPYRQEMTHSSLLCGGVPQELAAPWDVAFEKDDVALGGCPPHPSSLV